MRHRILTIALVLLACFTLQAKGPKYVFLVVGDGMGLNHIRLTEIYDKEMGLEQPVFLYWSGRSFLSNQSANSYVTDSAAAGTAIACGTKANNGSLGIDKDGNPYESLTVKAARSGKGTGVATTDEINQATPAAYYAHVQSRNDFENMNLQLVTSGINFLAGSTIGHSKGDSLKRWYLQAEQNGYKVFEGKENYSYVQGSNVMYYSHEYKSYISYINDRNEESINLCDFTNAAIEYLYGNYAKQGFFFMLENGNIDHASHANDAATIVAEVNELSDNVKIILDFYRQHPKQTLIIVTADHETGGLALGKFNKYIQHPEMLQYQKCSLEGLNAKINELRARVNGILSWEDIKALFTSELGLWDKVPVSASQEQELRGLYDETFVIGHDLSDVNLYSRNYTIAVKAVQIVNDAAYVGWSHKAHSGAYVPLFAIGEGAEEFLEYCKDNTDIPVAVSKIAGYK